MLDETSSMERGMTVSGLVEDVVVVLLLLFGVFLIREWTCFQRAKVSAMVNNCSSPNKALTLPALAAAAAAAAAADAVRYDIMIIDKMKELLDEIQLVSWSW